MHARFIKIESMATKGNILALIIGMCLFSVFVLPYLMYSLSVIDKHYIGWFHHTTLFAKTTNEKMYYLSENIPFVTITDIYAERDHHHARLAAGHPTYYQMYKDELFESVLTAIGYHKPMGRALQDEDEETTTADEASSGELATKAANPDDEESVLADEGPKYEALYPEPIMTLQQV